MLMRPDEIARLKMKSEYDDSANDWIIPPFKLKDREITLPSLKKVGKDVMEQEKENRELQIDGEEGGASESDNSAMNQGSKYTGGLFKPPSRREANSRDNHSSVPKHRNNRTGDRKIINAPQRGRDHSAMPPNYRWQFDDGEPQYMMSPDPMLNKNHKANA